MLLKLFLTPEWLVLDQLVSNQRAISASLISVIHPKCPGASNTVRTQGKTRLLQWKRASCELWYLVCFCDNAPPGGWILHNKLMSLVLFAPASLYVNRTQELGWTKRSWWPTWGLSPAPVQRWLHAPLLWPTSTSHIVHAFIMSVIITVSSRHRRHFWMPCRTRQRPAAPSSVSSELDSTPPSWWPTALTSTPGLPSLAHPDTSGPQTGEREGWEWVFHFDIKSLKKS